MILKIITLIYLFSQPLLGDPIAIVIGTRPEGIKIYPLYQALKDRGENVVLISTGQHKELLEEIFTTLNFYPDFNLNVMKKNQDLCYLTSEILKETQQLFKNILPKLVVVQGDTTTAMTSALSAFYLKIPVAHIEAGLRSDNIYSPYPEELNRQIISKIATYHFAPTPLEENRLLKEGEKHVFCTGNTVIDTLYQVTDQLKKGIIHPTEKTKLLVAEIKEKEEKALFLLTTHRRESLEKGLIPIFSAIKKALNHNPNLTIFFPVHPNPKIRQVINEMHLDLESQLILSPPLSYPDMIYLMNKADGIMTDSGGVQEEAVSLQKQTLILRSLTDRPTENPYSKIVGTDEKLIFDSICSILKNKKKPSNTVKTSPYGDGFAGRRIAKILSTLELSNP